MCYTNRIESMLNSDFSIYYEFPNDNTEYNNILQKIDMRKIIKFSIIISYHQRASHYNCFVKASKIKKA